MNELGQLEERHRDFADRGVRVVAVSLDGREDAAEMKQKQHFDHLLVAADCDGNLIRKLKFLDEGRRSPTDEDIAAPTTVLIDRDGTVRWLYRADRFIERLPPKRLLEAVDKYLPQPDAAGK